MVKNKEYRVSVYERIEDAIMKGEKTNFDDLNKN